MRHLLCALALVAAGSAAAPAAGETIRLNVQGTPPSSALEGDPNVIVCTRQQQIGSRLGAGQVCKTRAEWIVQRDDMRNQVANGQLRQVNRIGENGPTGAANGFFQPCTARFGC